MNGEYADESCMSLRFTVFEIYACKVEKLLTSRKFDIWPLMIGSNVDFGSHHRSRVLVKSNPLFFFLSLSSTTLSFETRVRTNLPFTGEGGEIRKTGED